MNETILDARPASRIDTDVLVVGGGAAGVAAAVTAARQGVRVLLLERYGFCGGGAVAGLSGTICGLYEAAESDTAPPRQIVFGFADEFVRTMSARNGLTGPVRYGRTFTRVHDPLVWRESADELLAEAGVHVLLHTLVTDVLTDGGERIAGVVAWTKQGRIEVRAGITVDASGDADLVTMAGLPFSVGHEGQVQNPTMIFRLQGVDVERFVATYGPDSILGADVMQAIVEANASGRYRLPRAKVFLFETPRPGELLCNATRIVGRDGRELNPINVADITEAEIEGRRQVREYARFFRDRLAGCEQAFVNDTGVQVGVRQTRQVDGITTLANEDVVTGVKRADGIARSPWPIELHSGEKPRLSWLFQDHYEVPYGCFVPQRGESLLVAGRCLSAQHEAMASARVTAQCFGYGHAIGHAAAIALRDGVAPRAIRGEDLRDVLNRDGARLDE
ncbi:FAD-dependent oxidoreductase [Pseudazoarcus pumilus]|uniref:FAD-dependent oxidoreductase n=1 Tax=Pseudazoarcus pumilus TaxID=2067960 RepID=A0A2I6SA54_9RHOO|nr:FAD-dependent oxidoreductase [Pseudazoarcus pumilus]AUN96134.1 FAD-dependent oxidoreductase [Pseudazoarcus pumilus]